MRGGARAAAAVEAALWGFERAAPTTVADDDGDDGEGVDAWTQRKTPTGTEIWSENAVTIFRAQLQCLLYAPLCYSRPRTR